MGKLTDIQIRAWTKAEKSVTKTDGDGLTFTLSAKRTSSWVLRYRTAGAKSQKEITLGRYPDISLAEARKLATSARVQIQQGADVAKQKQVAKKTAERSWTVHKLTDDYMAKTVGRLASSTIKGRKQQLRKHRAFIGQ